MSDRGGISLPSVPAQTPGLPESYRSIDFEKFTTLNTKPTRPAISPEEMYWCDGWMPIGPSNLRILWGTGAPLTTVSAGLSIAWFGFGNIGDTPYAVVVVSDGTIYAVNTITGIATPVSGAGTITNPSSVMGFSQWGSQYLIFAKDQPNGYWLWDGTLFFGAGAVGPVVTIDNGGSNYTSAPIVGFQTTGTGIGAGYVATVKNGSVTKIAPYLTGSGFGVNDFISLYVLGGGSDDQALAVAPVVIDTTTGGLDTVYVVAGGQSYTGRTFATVNGDGSGASVSLGITNGEITSAAIIYAGTGYTAATITITDPGIPGSGGSAVPGGSGGQVNCNVAYGQVVNVVIQYGGSGYISPPLVTIQGDGTGATGIATIANGTVTGVQMTNNGKGYTTALVSFSGGNKGANASTQLMPFGISGTAVEVYNSIVWVTNGGAVANQPPKNRTIFSSSGSPVDFGASGGAFQSNDSFLRVGYHWLRQTNGFLYLGGDSSINYISGVQTSTPSSSGVPAQAVTTFGNVNVDPQLGSPWPGSVQVFSRNIVFANSLGIFVSYGGAVTKASLPLDGFYGSGPIYSPTANFTSAIANIFGIPVYMLLLPVIDQITKQQVNKLLMWDGRHWFTSQQDRTLTLIASQEINSVLTAWGCDGTSLFPLFAQPSTGFTKRVQSKLYSDPVYWSNKTAIRLNGIAQSFAVDEALTIRVDNEVDVGTGNAVVQLLVAQNGVSWLNGPNPIVWNFSWGAPGLNVFGPYPIGQQGRLIGLTVETDASDIVLLSLNVGEQTYTLNA